MLLNPNMEIQINHRVKLDGRTFYPSDNLTAQAADPAQQRWLISYAAGNAVCTADLSELEQRKKEGFISYEQAFILTQRASRLALPSH